MGVEQSNRNFSARNGIELHITCLMHQNDAVPYKLWSLR